VTEHAPRATEWIYRGIFAGLVRWFRVPDRPPTFPANDPGEIDAFRPAIEFLKYLKTIFWIVMILIDAGILVAYVVAAVALWAADLWWVALLLLPPVLLIAFVPVVIGYVAIHLRYDTTHYVMTDRSIRIRRGVWIIHETTLTFENVQNLRISRGPLQQLFGIANLVLETAGSGGDAQGTGAASANQGVIEGIANAEALRDRILPHMRRSSAAGLGDEADDAPGWTAAHVEVLREIRNEITTLSTG